MPEVLIIFLAVVLGYTFLRMHGGEGLSIKAKLAPASTSKGKVDRLLTGIVGLIMIGVVVSLYLRQQSVGNESSVAFPFILGALTFLIFYIKDHRKK